MLRRRTLVKEEVEAVIPESDIVLYDSQLNKEIVICNLDYNLTDYPKDRFTPIGVVVIPQDHAKLLYSYKHSCYNKPVMMSLKYMRYDMPDTGGGVQELYFGNSETDLTLYKRTKVAIVKNLTAEEKPTANSNYGYIPSTRFDGDKESKAAPKTKYKSSTFCPSPFLFKNGVWGPNPAYYNCLASCAQRDREGKSNTETILKFVTVENWKTSDTIPYSTSAGNYPAACCCWRFHTVADRQGDWYLPAAGELCYIMPFFIQHNNAIRHINQVYGENFFEIDTNSIRPYSTSSEYSNNMVWCVSPDTGEIESRSKSVWCLVRAFRPVKI